MTRGKKLTTEQLAGQVFGRLVVQTLTQKDGKPYCTCTCTCGKTLDILWPSLRNGTTQSCGCLRAEKLSAHRRRHGVTTADGTEDEKRAFIVWMGMRDRCHNPRNKRYHIYGARGIKIDPTWDEFAQFLADMGPCPKGYSIERENNDGDYTKSNCYWWPRAKQSMNRQDTIRIRYQGQEWCFKRLCEYLKKPYLKTYKRYVTRGWNLARALDIPEENKNDLARIK